MTPMLLIPSSHTIDFAGVKMDFQNHLYFDVSTRSNSPHRSFHIPLITPNYAGKKIFFDGDLYGTQGFTNRSHHWCAFNQRDNNMKGYWHEDGDRFRPNQRIRHFNPHSNTWEGWDGRNFIFARNGMYGGHYVKLQIEITLKDNLNLWFCTQNNRYWDGSGFRLVGTFYYN